MNGRDESLGDQLLAVHRGDAAALQRLCAEHLPWLQAHVRRKLSPEIRADGETQDFVQEALLEVLRDGPRFVLADAGAFRALLARIVENNLLDRRRYLLRGCRDRRRQRPLPGDSVLHLDAPLRPVTEPPAHAERQERAAWLQLALELLAPDDREVVRLREWEGLQFAEVGAALGIGEEAARKRYTRALPKLAQKLDLLRQGRWRGELAEPPDGGG